MLRTVTTSGLLPYWLRNNQAFSLVCVTKL